MTTARPHQTRTARRRLLTSVAVVAAATALTAGCTGESKDNKAAAPSAPASSVAPTPSAAPSVSVDPEAADKAEVQTAYTRYWDVLTAAYSTADPQHSELGKVVTGTALVQNQQDLAQYRKGGRIFAGKPQHSNIVVTFKPEAKLKTAVITDCLDISQWKPVEKSSGTEVKLPESRLLRYVNTVIVEKWPNGWMVLEDNQEGKAC
ncbi:hypothetical protein ABZZ17_18460 [Streptomyces sp. NPDC006512]|uniref:hypothetical protein n=1 Tax=Streptomyces sp. NPDC006512 TaxID=3154307 RepID=UPI0033A0655C